MNMRFFLEGFNEKFRAGQIRWEAKMKKNLNHESTRNGTKKELAAPALFSSSCRFVLLSG
jgi:hypothetical protein